MRPRRDLVNKTVLLMVALCPEIGLAGGKAPVMLPTLTVEHQHPSGAFFFRTPEGWKVQPSPADPSALEAWGGDLGLRFLYRAGEAGYDSLHANCMLERLAGPMDTEPQVKYEYEYVGGVIGSRRALDSAFFVRYDQPRHGHRDWRQRTVTVVGQGDSLCVMSYVPRETWKSSPPSRALVDSVLASVTFRRP
jgi:hypothetical protein